MSKFKIGDKVKSLDYFNGIVVGDVHTVATVTSDMFTTKERPDLKCWDVKWELVQEAPKFSLEKAPIESPVTHQISIDGQSLTEQDVRDLIAFKKLVQEQLDKFGGK